MTKYLFILSFILVFSFFGLELGYTATVPVWKHFTYMFQHVNVWHLIINSVAFYSLFRIMQKFYRPGIIAVIIYACAVVGSFMMYYPIPVVGASAMVYVLLGWYISLIAKRKIIFHVKTDLIIFFATVITSLAVSFFHRNSAFTLHTLCLVMGFIIGIITFYFNKK